MGYIKKLKNNELVGGTDRTTIYPVTSTEAVFEEITNGNESSFKSQKTINKEQQDELDAHNGRVTYLENNAVKSVTINGGTKTYTVDDAGNVNLDVYTTESAEGQAALAEEVGDIRSIVGTKDSSTSGTLVTRVKTLETAVGAGGSVDQRIENAVNTLDEELTEDFTELYNYTHGLSDGIIVVTDHTQVSNPDTTKIYREAGTDTYTDWMYSNGWKQLATYAIDNLDAQVSYYRCETPAATAAKVVSATYNPNHPHLDEYVRTVGGHIKVWMKYANTSTGTITLKIGSTEATDLMYNGDPVSATNTWDAGEVLSVYYDGTYYQASNAQGGSNRKIDAYLLGDLRTLALGQTYVFNEAVKTIDKQFLRMNKEIALMKLTDTITEGDLKVYNNKTYQAQENIVAYAVGVEYEDGAYAFGCPAKLSLTIAREDGEYEDGTLDATIGEETNTISVLSADTPADIAGNIAASTWSDWYVSVDNTDPENIKVIAISKRAEVHVAGDIKIATNELGITGTGAAISAGSTTAIRKYNATDNVWTSTNLDNYSADTTVWVQVTDVNDLIPYTVQDTIDNLSFGSGKRRSVITTTTYNRSKATTAVGKYYYNAPAIGERWDGSVANFTNKYGYFIHVYPGDVITFLGRTDGYGNDFLLDIDGILLKKIHYTSVTNNLIWFVEQEGFFVYNGHNNGYDQFKITRTITYNTQSIEHLNPEDSLTSTDATKPLSANQGRILDERTKVVKNLMPNGATWDMSKPGSGRSLTVLDADNPRRIRYVQTTAMAGNYLTLDLTGLESGKTYKIKMNYSATKDLATRVKKFKTRSDTNMVTYTTTPTLHIADHRDIEFEIVFDGTRPFIGWTTIDIGTPFTFTIHSMSITETYYLEDVYNMVKEGNDSDEEENNLKKLRYLNQDSLSGVVTFLHYSDIHADEQCAKLISEYYDKYSDYIDDILDGGDDVLNTGNEGIAFLVNNGLGKALRSLGNHDINWSSLSDSQPANAYNTFFAPFVESWGVTQPADAAANYKMYWYKDYHNNVRLVCLSLYDDGNQITWLRDTLADAKANGKTVVILSHYTPTPKIESEASPINNILYRGDRTSFSAMGSRNESNGSSFRMDRTLINTVKAFVEGTDYFENNAGTVACWLCGHRHVDIFYHPEFIPDIAAISIDQAGTRTTTSLGESLRTGKELVCANIVGIDTSNKLVKLYRVGIRKDKYMRPINILTYNYNTKEVITNY